MATEATSRSRRGRRWRLGILLTIQAMALAAYIRSQLFPPPLFPPPMADELTNRDQSLVADVEALGGEAKRVERQFNVSFEGRPIDDETLGRFLSTHGGRLCGLSLRETPITDAGLRHIGRATDLLWLTLGNYDLRASNHIKWPTSPITDAGLIQLRWHPSLRSLSLNDIPISDAGLVHVKDIPMLERLDLTRTAVKGPGLGVLKEMPCLASLRLEGGEIDDRAMGYLAGTANLRSLELKDAGLTGDGLWHLKNSSGLRDLTLEQSGLLDEELALLRATIPGLTISVPK